MKFEIEGIPVAKIRHRTLKCGRSYDPKEKEKILWKTLVRKEWLKFTSGMLKNQPLYVKLYFGMPIPKSLSKRKRSSLYWHTKKPDADNLAKFILDVMNGIVYEDDKDVCWLFMKKVYTTRPRVEIEILIAGIDNDRLP